MLQTMSYSLFLFAASLSQDVKMPNSNSGSIIYTQEEMAEHRNRWKAFMSSNPSNLRDPSYQMQRALLTVTGDDADYIPKHPHAGEIFNIPGQIPYQLMHNGVKVVLNSYYDSQWLTDVICGLKGHHEPQEEKCFYEILKYIPENATMIEVGSYWAYYSLWFASEVKGAKNYLIEPDPKRLEVGRKNFELNDKTGFFYRGFVGTVFDDDPNLEGASCISLDDFMDKEKIDHVHILHADVQGSEYEMLLSSIRHLQDIDYFVISTHDHKGAHFACLDFFNAHGLTILATHTTGESCSGDGLIIAKRANLEGIQSIPIKKY